MLSFCSIRHQIASIFFGVNINIRFLLLWNAFHLSLWKISFALMQTLEQPGWNCCTASRGGGCSPCLFGGGLEWKEFEKAPQIDSKIGIVDNLRIWSHATKLFNCLWIHGEKTCEMKFSWLSSPKPTRTQRFQIQSQNSTLKKPTTKPTKTNHKTRKKQPQNPQKTTTKPRFVPTKMIPPFCWILLHDILQWPSPGYWDLTPWALLSTTSSGTFRKAAPKMSVPRSLFAANRPGLFFFSGTKLPCFVGWSTWFGVKIRMFSTLMSWKRIHGFQETDS